MSVEAKVQNLETVLWTLMATFKRVGPQYQYCFFSLERSFCFSRKFSKCTAEHIEGLETKLYNLKCNLYL